MYKNTTTVLVIKIAQMLIKWKPPLVMLELKYFN